MKVKPQYPDQDYDQIVRRLRTGGGGRLFEDERFSSDNRLLVRQDEIRWMRPTVSQLYRY